MTIFSLSWPGRLLRSGLLVIGSAVFISASANCAKSAIFTVEYSGTIDVSSSTSTDLDLTGRRIFGRYTFDDADNEIILSRYKLVDPTSTDESDLITGLDPQKIGQGESVFRQTIPPNSDTRLDVGLREDLGRSLSLTSSASKEAASFGEYRGIFVAGLVLYRQEFYVDENIFFQRIGIGSDGEFGTTSSGQIDMFRLVDNVTPDIATVPIIPTDFPGGDGTDIPEPATAVGLMAFVGVGVALKKR